MDSSGLGALVTLYLSAKRQHSERKLVHLGERLKELLRVTNLASVFEGHQEFLGWTPDLRVQSEGPGSCTGGAKSSRQRRRLNPAG